MPDKILIARQRATLCPRLQAGRWPGRIDHTRAGDGRGLKARPSPQCGGSDTKIYLRSRASNGNAPRVMFRVNYQIPGTPPATLIAREDASGKPPVISLIKYDQETLTEHSVETVEQLDDLFDPGKVNWINVNGLGDIGILRSLAERFGIHPLAMEDVLNTTQRPKLEQYDDHLFIVSEILYFDDSKRLAGEQLSMFLGENFVLTLQEGTGDALFDGLRARLRAGRGFSRKMKSDYLAYCLLDLIVDHFFPILETIGDSLDASEDELLVHPSRDALRNIYRTERLLLRLRRASWPQREILNAMMREEGDLVRPETHVFLRDCYDHVTQIIDMVETYRDLAGGQMDLHFASLDVRSNEIMKVLAVVATFFLPLTFLAGVYGMNFDTKFPGNMPELNWPFGYLFFWGLCLITALTMFILFKRKKWI